MTGTGAGTAITCPFSNEKGGGAWEENMNNTQTERLINDVAVGYCGGEKRTTHHGDLPFPCFKGTSTHHPQADHGSHVGKSNHSLEAIQFGRA
jgi:hypothetical protein